LEPGEKPRWTPGRVAILEGDDLAKVLDHAGPHRPLFETLAYTGLRIGEALGSVWADVDFDDGILHVHRQLSRGCGIGSWGRPASDNGRLCQGAGGHEGGHRCRRACMLTILSLPFLVRALSVERPA
jgi:hypothetical protein